MRVWNNPEITIVSDKARDLFIRKGFDYSDIKEEDFKRLVEILEEELKHANEDQIATMKIAKLNKNGDKYYFHSGRPDRSVDTAYIKVDSHYFKGREAITFNSNGWIGFAGWADSDNVLFFTNAFVKWVKELEEERING